MVHSRNNLLGKKFNYLLVIEQVKDKEIWKCSCVCGNIIKVRTCVLKSKKSCGCKQHHRILIHHGLQHTHEYKVWKQIIYRCHNNISSDYKYYGGRGIKVCKQWRDDFLVFYKDMGKCPCGYMIERKRNNGNYSPNNCKWASKYEQCRNTRRNVYLTYHGKTMIMKDWAEKLGVKNADLRYLIVVKGYSITKARRILKV